MFLMQGQCGALRRTATQGIAIAVLMTLFALAFILYRHAEPALSPSDRPSSLAGSSTSESSNNTGSSADSIGALRSRALSSSVPATQATKSANDTSACSMQTSTGKQNASVTEKRLAPSPSGKSGNGTYQLIQSCEAASFWDCWAFFTQPDYTHGQGESDVHSVQIARADEDDVVDYVSREEAESSKLIEINDEGHAVIRVDSSSDLAAGANRKSVRIESAKAVEKGSLLISDIVRMPFGPATWPAYWTVGPDWIEGGEVGRVGTSR